MTAHPPTILGRHLIAELSEADPARLNDADLLRAALLRAAAAGGFEVIAVQLHAFAPHGVTGVALLTTSHLSIHTWPEHRYAAVDIFTCEGDPWAALEALRVLLAADRVAVRELSRGLRDL